jgi:monovalent cation:proton antiporter-2 (CPA2) family protein
MGSSFLAQAFIYLAAAVVFVPIAKKMGMGSVLGYLIAGMIIGPFVLGFVGEEGADIMHFAEFGVVMMLFLVGLELEPALLWRLRASIMGLGGLQVLLSALLLGGLAMATGLTWQESLALGLILAMSSTAIVLQTLNEKGLMHSAAGQSSFAVLLFQDISVIPILAMLPLLSLTGGNKAEAGHDGGRNWVSALPVWAHTLVVLAAVAAVITAGRFLVRPLLRIVAKTRLRELFTASALLIVVGITVLMEKVGLSPALGTFLAGVVLANSEYRHELESDIDPFKGLLLGLFFMAVGASIDFHLIAAEPFRILLIVLTVMLVKAFVLFLLGRFFRLGTDQNLLFSMALSQTGEFAFVLLSFSAQEQILQGSTIRMVMAVVAITMAVTPLLLLVNERWIQPKVGTRETGEGRSMDTIEDRNSVIIAGFGHFGSTVGRFLRANGIVPTVLDIDSDRVDLLRKMGFKVYYGDASRQDLLLSAGAEQAKMIIIAIGIPEKTLEMVETVKKHFPHLHILVRARDRYDAYDLMDAGMMHIYRETIDTSLRLGQDALKLLGFRAYRTRRAASLFFRHDEKSLKTLASIRNDIGQYIISVRERIEEQEQIIRSDFSDTALHTDSGWDAEQLREDSRADAGITPGAPLG